MGIGQNNSMLTSPIYVSKYSGTEILAGINYQNMSSLQNMIRAHGDTKCDMQCVSEICPQDFCVIPTVYSLII